MRGQAFVDVVQNVNQGVIDVGHDVGKSATLLEGAGVFIPFLVLNVLPTGCILFHVITKTPACSNVRVGRRTSPVTP